MEGNDPIDSVNQLEHQVIWLGYRTRRCSNTTGYRKGSIFDPFDDGEDDDQKMNKVVVHKK